MTGVSALLSCGMSPTMVELKKACHNYIIRSLQFCFGENESMLSERLANSQTDSL